MAYVPWFLSQRENRNCVTQFFFLFISITFFVGMVVGGVASILGSLFGGLFVLFVPNIAESISRAAPGVIYGMILIIFLFVLPEGFAGLVRRILARLASRRN